jgi:hypothetical protein
VLIDSVPVHVTTNLQTYQPTGCSSILFMNCVCAGLVSAKEDTDRPTVSRAIRDSDMEKTTESDVLS